MARLVLLALAAAHAFTAPARTVAHHGRTRSFRGRSLAMVTTTASIEMNNGQVGVISSTRSKVSSAEAGNVVGALERLRQDLDSLEINIGSRPRVSVGEGAPKPGVSASDGDGRAGDAAVSTPSDGNG